MSTWASVALMGMLAPSALAQETEPPAEEPAAAAAEGSEPAAAEPSAPVSADPMVTETWQGKQRKTTKLERRMPRPVWSRHVMKRHVFRVPRLFDGAILSSHFGLRFGASVVRSKDFTDPLGRTFDMYGAGATGRFAVGVGFTDWIGLYGRVDGTFAMSTDELAENLFGSGGMMDWRVGLMVRPMRIEVSATQIVLRGGVQGDLSGWVFVEVDSQAAQQSDGLRLSQTAFRGYGTFGVAQTITPALGLQTNVEYSAGPLKNTLARNEVAAPVANAAPVVSEQSLSRVDWGSGLTVDTWPYVPIGLHVEYLMRTEWTKLKGDSADADKLTSHHISAGLYYTGTPGADVGMSVTAPLIGDDVVDAVQVEVILAVRL